MTKLSALRQIWNDAPMILGGEYEIPDDGTYQVLIEGVFYTEKDNEGKDSNPTFIYLLSIVNGPNKGMCFRKFSTIRNKKNISYLKGDLKRLGLVIPKDPEELPPILSSLKGAVIEVTVKTRTHEGKAYKDCHIERFISRNSDQKDSQNGYNQDDYTS